MKLTSCDITIFMMANLYSYTISKVGYIHDLAPNFASLTSLFLCLSPTNTRQLQISSYTPRNNFRKTFKQYSKTDCYSNRLFQIMYLVTIPPFWTRKFALPNCWCIYSTML